MTDRPDVDGLTAPMAEAQRAVGEAIATRRSVRGFRDTHIARETIEAILNLAARAPSGSNIQPWKVHVCAGGVRDDIVASVLKAAREEPEQHEAQYHYYPRAWRDPYISRRRATGWGLYGTLGIEKGDKARMAEQHQKNFTFFGAPVGLFFTIDNEMEQGSWLDFGMFLQTVMIAARGFGLDTCPQQAWSRYWRVVFHKLDIADDQILVCGMALGEIDEAEPANAFWTTRQRASEFASFKGF